MLIMLVFIFLDNKKFLYGRQHLVDRKINIWQVLLFFLIGIYGGFIHMGIGYFLLAALVLNAGYDLVRANALKVLIVLIYMPFSFIVFLIYSDINWAYGLIMMIGSVVGAYVASKLAVEKGIVFVKWVIAIVILFLVGHFFGLYDIRAWIGALLNS